MAATRARYSTQAVQASLWVLAAVVVVPTSAAAQEGCGLEEGSARLQSQPDPRGGSIQRFTTPHFVCEDDVEIWADSAVAYSYDAMSILYGSVRYVDRQREMRADNARYFTDVGRLQAQGHVVVTNFEDGSVVENGDLVYLRQTDYREVEEMIVTTGSDGVRPKATVYPQRAPVTESDSAAATRAPLEPDAGIPQPEVPEPSAPAAGPDDSVEADDLEPTEPEQYIVVGDSLVFQGNSYFNATGTVEIERDSLFGFSDFAEYTGELGQLILDGSARLEGDAYDLVGRVITLASASDGTDEVRSLEDAVLTGDDLLVTAPQIVLRLADGEIDHMVAVPLPTEDEGDGAPTRGAGPAPAQLDSTQALVRPIAISGDMELTGDSLDLAAPAGAIERIFAAGAARSVSRGRLDLNVEALPELAQTDWIDADSIEVMLVPLADSVADVRDATGGDAAYEVERIVAKVGARSLYRLLPADSTAVVGVDGPAVSYMVADTITIFMLDGQADRVESVGQVSGWHLEPLTTAPADSLAETEAADSVSTASPAGDEPTTPPQGPAGNNGGDGPAPHAYLSQGVRTPQPWRLQ
jgi:hypothetical protein